MTKVQEHLQLLGQKVKDMVTGHEGIVNSVCFDLYGCIQASLDQGFDKEGKRKDAFWFDVCRLKVLDKKPVIERPNFVEGYVAEGRSGAAEKPSIKV